jgi:hypothetical protein
MHTDMPQQSAGLIIGAVLGGSAVTCCALLGYHPLLPGRLPGSRTPAPAALPSLALRTTGDSGTGFRAAGAALLHWLVRYRDERCSTLPVISTVKPQYLRALVPPEAPGDLAATPPAQ